MSVREQYLEEVREILDSTVREHATTFEGSYCFDSVVNDNERSTRIVIKVSVTIDNVRQEALHELKKICRILRCTPIIIGEKTRKRALPDGVVHTRGNVVAINLETFRRIMAEDILPYVRVMKGGFYVTLNGQKLKSAREALNLSRGDVAEEVGVSRRAVYEYERGTMNPTIDVALRLEKLLETQLIEPLDILRCEAEDADTEPSIVEAKRRSLLVRRALKMLARLGLNSTITQEAPFDMLATLRHRVVLTCLKQRSEQLDENRLTFLAQLADVLHEHPAIIASDPRGVESIEGIPVVYMKELVSLQNPNELVSLIRRRRGA